MPCQPQLVPAADSSLNPELECQYCKDTSHLKKNCIKFNHRLALEQYEAAKKASNNAAGWPSTNTNSPI